MTVNASSAIFWLVAAVCLVVVVAFVVQHFYLKKSLPDQDLENSHIHKSLPKAQFMELDGFRIRYIQDGRGPDVVLIHGIGASMICWRLIFADLAKRYRVTALDLPGFGFSSKPTDRTYGLDDQAKRCWEFLTALKIERAILVGHSMGGTISSWMAKLEPKRTLKLALLAPALHHSVVLMSPRLMHMVASVVKSFIVTPTLVRTIYVNQCVETVPPDTEDVLYEFYRPYHRSPAAVTTFMLHNWLLSDKRVPRELADLKMPVLIVGGAQDKITKIKLLKDFLKLNPKTQYVVLEKTGHQVQEEKPKEVLELLHSFFDS